MPRRNLTSKDTQKTIGRFTNHLWVESLARLGYGAKGLVYLTVGLLAAQAAVSSSGSLTNTSGALEAIVTQPFGKFLLILITVGLLGYVLWRVVQATLDPQHAGETINLKRVIQRAGYAFSALAYSGLALTAIKLIFASSSDSVVSSSSIEDWTVRLMAQPFGRWLVALSGLLTIGVGFVYLHEAHTARFRKRFKLNEMTTTERTWTIRIGKFGIAARGVVFCIIGAFLIQAALLADASRARGLSGTLKTLDRQSFGALFLSLIAFGLIAYGFYSMLEARYRQFVAPSTQVKAD